jgi:hypothetical protein
MRDERHARTEPIDQFRQQAGALPEEEGKSGVESYEAVAVTTVRSAAPHDRLVAGRVVSYGLLEVIQDAPKGGGGVDGVGVALDMTRTSYRRWEELRGVVRGDPEGGHACHDRVRSLGRWRATSLSAVSSRWPFGRSWGSSKRPLEKGRPCSAASRTP